MKKLFLIIITLCTACSLDEEKTDDPVFCTQEAVPGLEISIKDGATDSFLTGGVTVVATDGEYKETLENYTNTNVFVGAFERTGTYIVTASKEGYQTTTSTIPIIVDKDICHVITESRELVLKLN